MKSALFSRRCASLAVAILALLAAARGNVVITEIDAINNGTTTDVDGNTSDWIEIRNTGSTAVNLNGWALSNNPADPGRWTFPSVNLNANQQVLVFASNKDRSVAGVQLHTNFRLSDEGSVVLSEPDGAGGWTTVHSILNYPRQRPGITYGFASSSPTGARGYFLTPSPNALNSATVVTAFVADTKFDFKRGFYDAPFTLTITSSTPGATIVYTVNGSEPTASNGTQVPPPDASTPPTAQVSITGTRIIRARAMKTGMAPTNVDTQTYLFPAQVLAQNGPLDGQTSLPWSHFGTADWAMDPGIVNHSNPNIRATADDLKSIPTISVVMDWNDLFGGATAIYPPASGVAQEGVDRRASIELINPDGSKTDPNLKDGFKADGHAHIFGGTSINRWRSDKLSFNFGFWQDLNYPVFGQGATKRFDKLILDARFNNVWTYGGGSAPTAQQARSDYYGDALVSDLHRMGGGAGVHTRVMHVYLNGLYWGIYSVHERPDHHFTSDYLGGGEEEWDVLKHNTTVENIVAGKRINPAQANSVSNNTAGVNYQALLNLAAADLTVQANYNALAAKLDLEDLANYMLMNFYLGNTDWAHQNWYASYNREQPDGKWRYHVWDAEHIMESATQNVTARDDATGPTRIHQRLRTNAEYRLLFADVAHRHFFNNGMLTNPRIWEIFDGEMQKFAEALRTESARWGDNRRVPPYTRADWDLQRTWWKDTYFPTRSAATGTGSVLTQLRSQGIYPTVNAPSYNQHGGAVPADFSVTMTNPNGATGTIYYTTDGSDPRVALTGAISPSATAYTEAVQLSSSRTVKARVRSGTTWSALNEAYFSVNTVPAGAGNLVISKIQFRPAPATAEEIAAGFSRSDFEFVEVMNISSQRVDIHGIAFSAGLDTRPLADGVRELAPGERALFVANKAAFELRYGAGLPIAGEFWFSSGLSSTGERLSLEAADASVIVSFSYKSSAPWPAGADGSGRSLVLVRPETSDPADGLNWRISTAADGAPGVDDRLRYAAWAAEHFEINEPGYPEIAAPLADAEADGLQNVVEFFLGTPPRQPTPPELLPFLSSVSIDSGGGALSYPVFTFRYVRAAEEVTFAPQTSTNLTDWSQVGMVLYGAPTDHGDGTESRSYRSTEPFTSEEKRFFRLWLQMQ